MLGGKRKRRSAGTIPPTVRFLCDSLLYVACFAGLFLVVKYVSMPSKPKKSIRMDVFEIRDEPETRSRANDTINVKLHMSNVTRQQQAANHHSSGGALPTSHIHSSVHRYVFWGSFFFGGYIIASLTLGRYIAKFMKAARRPLFQLRGRKLSIVHFIEMIFVCFSLGCVEGCTIIHHYLIVPLLCNGAEVLIKHLPPCRHSTSWFLIHFCPSLYFHVCFYFNWYMCIFGTKPSACHDEGSERVSSEDRVDDEHWSYTLEAGDLEQVEKKKKGPLGTDGDLARGHFCSVCASYVVRCDHHCPFLGVCVGAHNQIYFFAMMLQMSLSMIYGSLLVIPASVACQLSETVKLSSEANQKCFALSAVSVAVVFVAMVISAFTFIVFFLLACNLTMREALMIDMYKYKIGFTSVVREIWRKAPVSENLQVAFGPRKGWWKLLLPMKRASLRVMPLNLPKESDLSVRGVYW
uniref:Palmitoyltransferase n=1 Tax=Guillardia theta TaxID=55529 RepID=A0A7S4K7J1_GUITH|mmetsp:Transcript_21690/g.71742  ORF Transcript_21690/g.71742 Transcript_21690/m.71742 type:complete len:464 (+) Transcript_21690:61-1452(+)